MNRVNAPRRTQALTPLALALLAVFPLWTQAASIECLTLGDKTKNPQRRTNSQYRDLKDRPNARFMAKSVPCLVIANFSDIFHR